MTLQASELERLLNMLLAEHIRLLDELDLHQKAMKTLRFEDLNQASERIEASRTRIVTIDNRRRFVSLQITKALKINSEPSLAQLAEHLPAHRVALLKLRDELKLVTGKITRKTNVTSRLSGALLGHLNTVVRLIAGAVQQAGVYTKQGMPTVSSRIGVIEAVG